VSATERPYRTASLDLYRLSAWIDAGNLHRDPEAATWGRLAKVSEECGEVIAAYIGATGQNPRKGHTHTLDHVEDELLDVAVTALCAVAHLYDMDDSPKRDVMELLRWKIERVVARALPDVTADQAVQR
jgi:NTP pyrophosphatase (non-canonical NTP hydrolase)